MSPNIEAPEHRAPTDISLRHICAHGCATRQITSRTDPSSHKHHFAEKMACPGRLLFCLRRRRGGVRGRHNQGDSADGQQDNQRAGPVGDAMTDGSVEQSTENRSQD